MEQYTTSVSVSIKSCGSNQRGETTTRNIKIPVVKPRPRPRDFQRRAQVTPFCEISNVGGECYRLEENISLYSTDTNYHQEIQIPNRENTFYANDYGTSMPTSSGYEESSHGDDEEENSLFDDILTPRNIIAAFEGIVEALDVLDLVED